MFYMIQTHLSENNRQNLSYPNKKVEQNGIKISFTTKIRIVNYLKEVKLNQIGFALTWDIEKFLNRLFSI